MAHFDLDGDGHLDEHEFIEMCLVPSLASADSCLFEVSHGDGLQVQEQALRSNDDAIADTCSPSLTVWWPQDRHDTAPEGSRGD